MVNDHSDSESKPTAVTLQLAARVLLCAPSHRQDSTYHSLCYTSCGALPGTTGFISDANVKKIKCVKCIIK